jgi:phenylalanyl-tRNA synthetase beta chain
MRVPLSWLGEFVELPSNSNAESVMAELVKVGLEEEGSHGYGLTGPIVVGQVLEFVEEEQSNGKTIRWCQVRVAPSGKKAGDGGEDVRGIVCGARNFEVNDKVVVTLPGAVLPRDFKIAARSTYGHTSDGMIASARELGLSDDHEGILRLTTLGIDPEVGTDALALLGLNDEAAEVNVTPDRGYCFSIRGIAREFAHATGAKFTDPIDSVKPAHGDGFKVEIKDDAPIRGRVGSTKFVLRSASNVKAASPTPAWMVSRLKLSGMRSISIVVDITNYVMLEMGQPLHAYDSAKLNGSITVRRAKSGESLKTLDGQDRKLNSEDLVIADTSGAVGLAGVMGGASTEVSQSTTSVLIEAANFDGVSIARSARRHKLPSEASKRFERGVDPKVAEYAAARAIALLEELAGAKADSLGSFVDNSPSATTVFLPANFAAELTGVDYTAAEITSTLNEIGCVVASVDSGFEVIVPSWRPDITHKTDLVEEVARITGYDRIPSRLPVAPPGRGLTRRQKMRRAVMNQLSATGHVEVLTYPFLKPEQNSYFAEVNSARVVLANAMQEDVNEMRLTMLPGLMDAAKRNVSRTLTDLSIYEVGLVFNPAKSSKPVSLPNGTTLPSAKDLELLHQSVPQQPLYLGALFVGNRISEQVGRKASRSGYADAIQAARVTAHAVGLELDLVQATPKGFHPGRTAALVIRGTQITVGYAGELHPELALANDLPRQAGVVEINLELLFANAPELIQAGAVDTYPAATQDLSLVIDLNVPAGAVLAVLAEAAGELLEEIVLVDDYRGTNLEEGKKSLTFALRFRANDRTLTQVEASVARDNAVSAANAKFGATIRA